MTLSAEEYFQRQCWVSFDPGERTASVLGPLIGPDRMIWASDFPHNDAKYPGVIEELREHNDGLPEVDRRALYGLNACDMYDIAV
jgi:predicted TIM-barrel fold metal-dependent hydrolase